MTTERSGRDRRVFVHIPTGDISVWRNEFRVFSQIPRVGEYVCLGAREKWHMVTVVVHCAFDAPYAAEIFTESKDVALHEIQPPLRSR